MEDILSSQLSTASSVGEHVNNLGFITEELKSVLQSTFGHTELRLPQTYIINAVLARLDVIGVLPTGGGKSLCFQLPAVLLGGLTLVVCPRKSYPISL